MSPKHEIINAGKKKKKHEIIKMEANLQRATITTPKLIKYEKLVNSKKVGN